jgi:hypothetical protein
MVCRAGRPGSNIEAGEGVERRPDRLAAASVRGDTPDAAEQRHDGDSATGSVEGGARTHDRLARRPVAYLHQQRLCDARESDCEWGEGVRQGLGGDLARDQSDVVDQVRQVVLDQALADEPSGSRCAGGVRRKVEVVSPHHRDLAQQVVPAHGEALLGTANLSAESEHSQPCRLSLPTRADGHRTAARKGHPCSSPVSYR